MSTDLEFRQDLVGIQLSAVKIKASPSSSGTVADHNSDAIETENCAGDEEQCRTPTSSEHRIPTFLSCPPAPRKRRPEAPCKRKLINQLSFFEIIGREEVESFFRTGIEIASVDFRGAVKKKRCAV